MEMQSSPGLFCITNLTQNVMSPMHREAGGLWEGHQPEPSVRACVSCQQGIACTDKTF